MWGVRAGITLAAAVLVSGCAEGWVEGPTYGELESRIGVLEHRIDQIEKRTGVARGTVESEEPPQVARRETPVAQDDVRADDVEALEPEAGESFLPPPGISVQQALQGAGFYDGKLDGKIGPLTRSAIREFQRMNGLQVDGTIGRQTWKKLRIYTAANGTSE